MSGSALHERLRGVAGDLTYRALGEMTETNAETVRRYMQGQAPSVEFLTRLCGAMGLNAHWLLTGAGPARVSEASRRALDDASATDLLAAIARSLEALTDRVDRLEVFVQTMEGRILSRARAEPGAEGDEHEPAARAGRGGAGTDGAPARTRRIADAVAERPPPPAD